MKDKQTSTVLKEKCERLRLENNELKMTLAEIGFIEARSDEESQEYGPETEEKIRREYFEAIQRAQQRDQMLQ